MWSLGGPGVSRDGSSAGGGVGPRGDWVGGTQASKHPPRMGFLLHVCRNEAPLAPQSLLGGRRGRPGRGSPLPTSWGSGPVRTRPARGPQEWTTFWLYGRLGHPESTFLPKPCLALLVTSGALPLAAPGRSQPRRQEATGKLGTSSCAACGSGRSPDGQLEREPGHQLSPR